MDEIVKEFRDATGEQVDRLLRAIDRRDDVPRAEKVTALMTTLNRAADAVFELTRTAPKEAPEIFNERRDRSENAYQFIHRVYGEWIERGLSLNDIRKLDKKLYQAVADRKRRNPEDTSLYLPKISETVDQKLAEYGNPSSFSEIVNTLPRIFRGRFSLYKASRRRAQRAAAG